MYDIF